MDSFTVAEWDTDAATDKLCEVIFAPKPQKKKSGTARVPGKQALEEDGNMKHSKRYQKNRKKKQLQLKKTAQADVDQENVTKTPEAMREKWKKKKEEKQKKKSAVKEAKSVPGIEPLKKKDAVALKKNGRKNEKKSLVKEKQRESEQHMTSVVQKKSTNKYKHLAGKGKRINSLSSVQTEKPVVLDNGDECGMEVDCGMREPKDVVNKSRKRKKLETKSDDVIVTKKPKLKQAQKPVPEKNATDSMDKELDEKESGAPENTEKVQKKKKRKTKDKAAGNGLITAQTVKDELEKKSESPESAKKKRKKKAQQKSVQGSSVNDVSKDTASPQTESSQKGTVKTLQTPTPRKLVKKTPHQLEKIRALLQAKDAKIPTEAQVDSAPAQQKKKSPKKTGPLSLKERMEEQLKAARFRFLNEQLYTGDSKSAQELFADDPEAFQLYHHGYQAQVSKWPANPVDKAISYVKARPQHLVVADFGCGDAKLAQSVPNKVHSFDLVAVNEHVKVADSANVPLPNRSVDIAVFSLSLMGTNFVDFLIEANRVLKSSGTLLVAEVVSRFEKIAKFPKKLEKLGFKLVNMEQNNKMFVWFEFNKTKAVTEDTAIPDMELLPCIYKKR